MSLRFPLAVLACLVFLSLVLSAPAAVLQDSPGQLTDVHKHMAQCVGEYTTVTRFQAPGQDAASETTGTATIKLVLGGRFLQEEASGTMMGQPYSSMKLTGYNSATKKFEATWVYTASTSMMSVLGESKDGGRTINWVGTYEQTPGEKSNLYIDTKHLDKDKIVVEMYHKNADGSRGPTMSTTYTRKK